MNENNIIPLYYQDPLLLTFQGRLISQTPVEEGFEVLLNQTAFYPEGGGQPADRGTLNGIPVLHVRKEEGKIYHLLTEELSGDLIDGHVDKEWRQEYSVKHTGQHLISALLSKRNANTVAVHLGKDYITIETDGMVPDKDVYLEVEREANRLLAMNFNIRSFEIDESEVDKWELRRVPKVNGTIRIIEIEGVDTTPCGGIHCQKTGQIGLVSFLKSEKIRKRMRSYWLAGDLAQNESRRRFDAVDEIGTLLSVPAAEVAQEVKQLFDEKNNTEYRLRSIANDLGNLLAEKLLTENQSSSLNTPVIAFCSHYGEEVNDALMRTLGTSKAPLTVFLYSEGTKRFKWRLYSKTTDETYNLFSSEILPLFNGRGGGRQPLWRGVGEGKITDKILLKIKKLFSQFGGD